MNKVYITAYSAVSALGVGVKEAVFNLKKEIQPIKYPGEGDKFHKPYFEISTSLNVDVSKTRCSQLAIELLSHLRKDVEKIGYIPIFGATNTGGIKETEEVFEKLSLSEITYSLYEKHFFDKIYKDLDELYPGMLIQSGTFSTACSSAGHTILQAYNFIKHGIIDKALVIGVDSLAYTTMIGFDSLQLVSSTGTAPLTKNRDGLSLGEGGGILLLEANPQNDPVAEIVGGYSNTDGYHISSPDPEGTMQKKCIINAVKSSGLDFSQIDYINAHGTGTIINDETELKVIESVFDSSTIVTSTKSFIGHTLGASAVTEVSIVLEMLKDGKIYQPSNFEGPISTYIPIQTVSKKVSYFVKNSFGFGGNNVSLVFKSHL